MLVGKVRGVAEKKPRQTHHPQRIKVRFLALARASVGRSSLSLSISFFLTRVSFLPSLPALLACLRRSGRGFFVPSPGCVSSGRVLTCPRASGAIRAGSSNLRYFRQCRLSFLGAVMVDSHTEIVTSGSERRLSGSRARTPTRSTQVHSTNGRDHAVNSLSASPHADHSGQQFQE